MKALLDGLSALQTRHPLLLFVALGAAVFLLLREAPAETTAEDTQRIALSAAQLQQLRERHPDRDPDALNAAERRAALGDWLVQQVLSAEARKLGLDVADPIIERRLAQKMRMLLEDLHPIEEPDDAALQAWLDDRKTEYGDPPRFSFEQVFLAREQYGSDAEKWAETFLAQLRAGQASHQTLGSHFPAGTVIRSMPERQLRKHFGRSFAEALAATAPGTWQGPLESGYGLHLVRITEVRPYTPWTLDAARERILRDYQRVRRQQRNLELIDALIEAYDFSLPAAAANRDTQ